MVRPCHVLQPAREELIAEDNGLLTISANNVLTYTEDPDEAASWARAIEDGERRGSLFIISGNRMWGGDVALARGDLVEAEDLLARARARRSSSASTARAPRPTAPRSCATRGSNEATRRLRRPRCSSQATIATARTACASARQPHAAARRAGPARGGAGRRPPPSSSATPGSRTRSWAGGGRCGAAALHALGRRDEALASAGEGLELARAFGAPRGIGHALRVVGELEGSVATLREAADVLGGSLGRLDHARALFAYGAAAGDVAALRRAYELAAACGADRLVADAAAALVGAGEPAPTLVGNVDALTAAERRVAALAAEGRSARDIAQALFLTPRSVEVELASATRKLGVGSPAELAEVLRAA